MIKSQAKLGWRAMSAVVVLLFMAQAVLSQPPTTLTERETDLGKRLLAGYSTEALPVPEGGLQVEVSIALGQFVAINTALETVEFQGWWRLYWTDPRLSWDSEVEDVQAMSFKTSQVWMPDITVYEQITDATSPSLVTVSPDGSCYTSIPRRTKIGCPMMISSFPYDRQRCNFSIGSWSYDGTRLDVVPRKQNTSDLLMDGDLPDRLPFDLDPYKGFQEFWLAAVKTIWKNSYYNCCPNPYPILLIEFDLYRSTQTYISGMVVPLILVTCVGFFSLWMPAPPSGARPALSVTVMLTTATVYFVASRSTPQSNQSTSIGRIYIYSLSSSFFLVFLSIITTALNLIQPEDKGQIKHLLDFFDRYDTDKNGVLDKEEFDIALSELGSNHAERLTEAERNKVMKFFITDEDPTINKEQWRAFSTITEKADDDAVYHSWLVRMMVHKVMEWKIKKSGKGLGKQFDPVLARATSDAGFSRGRSAAPPPPPAEEPAETNFSQPAQRSVNSLVPSNPAMEMRALPPMGQMQGSVGGPTLAFSDPGFMGYNMSGFAPNGQAQWAHGMRFGQPPPTPPSVQWAAGMAFGNANGTNGADGVPDDWAEKKGGGFTKTFSNGQFPVKPPSGNPSLKKVSKKMSAILNANVSEIPGPPRVGRELASYIDKWARRLMPLGFFIFLVCEFTGVISGGERLGELTFFKDSEGNAKTRVEYFDYRTDPNEPACFVNFPKTRQSENLFDEAEGSCEFLKR